MPIAEPSVQPLPYAASLRHVRALGRSRSATAGLSPEKHAAETSSCSAPPRLPGRLPQAGPLTSRCDETTCESQKTVTMLFTISTALMACKAESWLLRPCFSIASQSAHRGQPTLGRTHRRCMISREYMTFRLMLSASWSCGRIGVPGGRRPGVLGGQRPITPFRTWAKLTWPPVFLCAASLGVPISGIVRALAIWSALAVTMASRASRRNSSFWQRTSQDPSWRLSPNRSVYASRA